MVVSLVGARIIAGITAWIIPVVLPLGWAAKIVVAIILIVAIISVVTVVSVVAFVTVLAPVGKRIWPWAACAQLLLRVVGAGAVFIAIAVAPGLLYRQSATVDAAKVAWARAVARLPGFTRGQRKPIGWWRCAGARAAVAARRGHTRGAAQVAHQSRGIGRA